jgi:hypothetical protein
MVILWTHTGSPYESMIPVKGEWSFMLTLFLSFFLLPAGNGQSNSPEVYTPVSYCELVGHPMEYDGKRIAVRASYVLGFEVQVMLSLKCPDWTFPAFMPETHKAERVLTEARRPGTSNATFYGVFHKELLIKTSELQGSYQLDVQYMEDVKIISKTIQGLHGLSRKEQQRLCQGDEVPNVREK